jgi:serine/threonine-protein phosphatase PP1 catalytic subunit
MNKRCKMSKLILFDSKHIQSFRTLSVIGDLHGDYEALQVALKMVDPGEDGIVFLGDYADRGSSGIEVISAVDSMKRSYPQNVFALKGNHEDYTEAGQPEFWPCTLIEEVQSKGKEWQRYFQKMFKPFVQSLPIAILVQGETLFVHGGISTKIRGIGDLINPKRDVELDILWSDPFEGDGELPNYERGGVGVVFGQDVTESICKLLEVKRIVRSHQPAKAFTGPFYSHNGRVITISSTSVYGGQPFLLNINPIDPSNLRFINLNLPGDVSNSIP